MKIAKKVIGVILIIVGIVSILTPFTPGGWLLFVGLELIGVKFLLNSRIRDWFKKGKSV